MKKKNMLLMILLCVLGSNNLFAKDNDFASWIDASATKSWRSTTLGFMGEFYTRENSSTLERTSLGLKGEYTLAKWLYAGGGYLLMNYKRPGYMELRNRFYFQLEPVWRIAKFEVSLRERVQVTLFPETRTNAEDSYYWRNRLEAIYTRNNKKLEPTLSLESFYFLRQTENNHLDELRLSLGAYFHISKTQTIKCYGLFSDGNIQNRFVLGLNYELEL